ncbi:hypothetical protein EMPS_07625 [Entomortierella parvispora]|uniref:Arm-like repeat domain-containing protein n=1 Tax=Entomortierella parvispora TaxID=205924 RepID=A0A9P3HER5_9FUNG|nr:hypothetical protein EMPS_07625 [Entomortierella parvispora]
MTKSPSLTKPHAWDSSASASKKSLASALSGIIKLPISVGAPHAVSKSGTPPSTLTVPKTRPKSTPASTATGGSTSSSSPSTSFGVPSPSRDISNTEYSPPVIWNVKTVPSNIFSANASKIKEGTPLPKAGGRIETTAQLVACAKLLAWTAGRTSDSASADIDTSMDEPASSHKWIQEMEGRVLEKGYIQQLMNRMVDTFIALPSKPLDAIREIILLGPVLGKDLYRALINRFLFELEKDTDPNIHLVEGLISLVECAPPLHLQANVLTKIFHTVRDHLRTQRDTEYIIHLTTAISKVLVIMVESGVNMNREREHQPLLEILSNLRKHADPMVKYQVEYAYRTLRLVPDDETVRQGVTRNVIGLLEGLLRGSAAIQLDFSGIPEAARAIAVSGRGLVKCLQQNFASEDSNPWIHDVWKAEAMAIEGRLVEFNQLINNSACRHDSFFQWGVCTILGTIAVDPLWDVTPRREAVEFLGELFKSNSASDHDLDVCRWILTLLRHISELPNTGPSSNLNSDMVQQRARDRVSECEYAGLGREQRLRQPCVAINCHCLATSSSLLRGAHDNPDLELILERLRYHRLEAYSRHTVYIPTMSKSNLQALDENPKPLLERVHQFLGGNGLVMLILGDSGTGKSTFNSILEQDLWNSYRQGGRIPLLIDLKAVRHSEDNLTEQHLKSLKVFSESNMADLRTREFILICDGYDESQSRSNLYTNSRFSELNQWRTKMIVSCRTQYLSPEYRSYFTPQQDALACYGLSSTELLTEAFIAPLNDDQIEEYISKYTENTETNGNRARWTKDQYLERLKKITHVMDLIKNPFMLSMILEILPVVAGTTSQMTRVELYDEFVGLHYRNEQKRLIERRSRIKMDSNRLAVFQEIEGPNFIERGIDFSKRLANAIFDKQDGNNSVEYWSIADKESWKRDFFGIEPRTQLLMEACQLIRRTCTPDNPDQTSGKGYSTGSMDTFKFSHSSILEYFYALSIYDPKKGLPLFHSTDHSSHAADSVSSSDHPLSRQTLSKKPAILQFLAERVRCDIKFKGHLDELIQRSKFEPSFRHASSNAITILVRAGKQFNGADLRGIRVPGADLSGGNFDSAKLQNADLSNTVLRNVWLHQANLSHSTMDGVTFGEYPCLKVLRVVQYCVFSPDGKHLDVGLKSGQSLKYDTATWMKEVLPWNTSDFTAIAHSPNDHQTASASGHTVELWDAQTRAVHFSLNGHNARVTSLAYSPNGCRIASGSEDKNVRLWNTQTGLPVSSFDASSFVSSVAYSPSGCQIASGCYDWLVRLWDTKTEDLTFSLKGHSERVTSVAYSPIGHQIASGSYDKTVRLWNAQTGAFILALSGHTGRVTSVAYSPNGHQIASGSTDKTVRLWDAQTGTPLSTLSGHTNGITSVSYSPCGRLIASGSFDWTVRLWDAHTSALASSTNGHTHSVASLAFSPNSLQIASGSWDNSIRLWNAKTGEQISLMRGHDHKVTSVAYSPSGHQLASGSYDKTVRLWDAHTGAFISSLEGHLDKVTSVAISPSGHQIASGSWDQTVRLWNPKTGAFISLSDHTNSVMSVAYSPNGLQIASSSADNTVRLWDAEAGTLAFTLEGHTNRVTSVSYSPSGHHIASGSYDTTVIIWDTRIGTIVSSLRGHTWHVTSVAYSPNDLWIASGSEDKTVRLWDANSGECLLVLDSDLQDIVYSVAWKHTGDDMGLVVGDGARSINSWKVVHDGEQAEVRLNWRSTPDTLVLSNAIINDVRNLSRTNLRLLKQRSAVGRSQSS